MGKKAAFTGMETWNWDGNTDEVRGLLGGPWGERPRSRSTISITINGGLQSPTRFLHARHFPSKEGLGWIRGRGFT